jgi:DUF2934 family protein
MASDMDVRQTAYLLWEQDGKPEGRELDYWLAAEQILDGGSGNGNGKSAAKKAPARRASAAKAAPKTATRSRSKAKEPKELQTP